MAKALISCVREQLVSFLLQEENEDVNSFLVQKAKQGLGLIVKTLGGLEEKVQKLINNFEDIQAVLEDAERRQVKEASVRRWLKKLKDVAYDVEDLLEEWNIAKLRSKLEKAERDAENEPLLKKVRYYFSSSSAQLIKHLGIAQKINDFNERLNAIAVEKERYMFQVDEKGFENQLERRTVSFVDEKEVYGRDEAKTTLLRMVLSENTSVEEESSLPVISVVGMGGIGKTTLAQLVFHAPEIPSSHFDERFWVCVSDFFDNTRIAKAILESNKNEASNLVELETLLKNVRERVSGKKILLVLDDVWPHNPRIWEQLKDSLKSCSPGSKILITTRSEVVAINVGTLPANIFPVKNLSEEECWRLFSRKAFQGRTKEECESFEDIGRKIVKKCKGLPLAAKVLGGLMRLKRTEEQWQSILGSEIWELEAVESGLFPPLLLSYYDLHSALKRCFSYCAVFPKDKYIRKDELIKLWMAQGYLQGTECKDMEILGQEYFDELAMRSFFQDFIKDVNNNNIIRCKMHDIVHDCAQFLTKPECVSVAVNGAKEVDLFEETHHLSLTYAGAEDVSVPECIHKAKKLRSLLIEWPSFHVSSALEVASLSKLFDQLTHLRAVNLSVCWFKELPESIGKLMHLKYLNLSHNSRLKELPEVVCDLCHLQTLDLTNCWNLEKLPSGLGKLSNLRHLRNGGIQKVKFMPNGMGRLTCLRTLDVFLVDGSTTNLEDLGDLMTRLQGHLRIFVFENAINNYRREGRRAKLDDKKGLQSMELRFTSKIKDVDAFVLEGLQPPPNLERLQINNYSGPAELPSSWMMSLTKLKKIELAFCEKWDYLPPLGKLLFLEQLTIVGMRVKKVGVEFLGVEGEAGPSSVSIIAFPNLKFLEFREMKEWEEWDYNRMSSSTEVEIMPNLQSLRIADCPMLKELPCHLPRNPTLKKLFIYECPILEQHCKTGGQNAWNINVSPQPHFFFAYGSLCTNMGSFVENSLEKMGSLLKEPDEAEEAALLLKQSLQSLLQMKMELKEKQSLLQIKMLELLNIRRSC